MNRIPVHAAVSESVKLARKKANPSAAGFVNAILRKIAGQGIPEIDTTDDIEYLSVKYSHPRWLTQRIVDELGREDGERYLACDNELAPICAQVNTLKATTDEVISSLADEGVTVRRAMNGLELMGTGDPSDLTVFKNGSIFIQDNAANLAVRVADPKPDMWVLDGCAAPGGKSFAAAVMMENRGRILSRDIHEKKLVRIDREAARLGIDIIETEAGDARVLRPDMEKRFDVVIADVPCSGLGVIRKKPDIRFKKPEDIEGLPEIQLAILTNLAKCCKPGGTVLYSTCTILSRENGDVVRRFLSENSGYRLEPFDMSEDGMLTLYPHIHGTDGFFIARLRRDNG
jgi:16S rRNA (cytosine967-C5)-methyltransferase